jgi:hypothetical protein
MQNSQKKRWMGMLTDRRNPYLHIWGMLSALAPPTPRNLLPSPSWAQRPEECERTAQHKVYGFRYTDSLRSDGNIFAHLITRFDRNLGQQQQPQQQQQPCALLNEANLGCAF